MGGVLAVVSQKGGVGKTTTAINLAAALAWRGVKTLLVDTDPQGSVRYGLGLFGAEYGRGLSDYLKGASALGDIVRPTTLPWLRAILAGSVTDDRSHDEYVAAVAESPLVADLLARARQRGYVVVVDTPPGLGPVGRRLLTCSQQVLVPLQCEPLALQTTAQILRGVRDAAAENPQLAFAGLLLTMYEPGSPASERIAEQVRARLPRELVLDIVVPRSTAAVEAFAAGQPLLLRAPGDPAALAYAALAEQLAPRLQ